MRRSRVIASVVIALIGLFWIGQGSGIIPGSLMSGNAFWSAVGVVLVVVAVAIFAREWMRQRSSPP